MTLGLCPVPAPNPPRIAAASCRKSLWARAYYEQPWKPGAGHHATVRFLAYKWIRILLPLGRTARLTTSRLSEISPAAPLAAVARHHLAVSSGGHA